MVSLLRMSDDAVSRLLAGENRFCERKKRCFSTLDAAGKLAFPFARMLATLETYDTTCATENTVDINLFAYVQTHGERLRLISSGIRPGTTCDDLLQHESNREH